MLRIRNGVKSLLLCRSERLCWNQLGISVAAQPGCTRKNASSSAIAATGAVTVSGSHPVLMGFWQSLSNSVPVGSIQQLLTEFHDYTGLPWWGSIVCSTLLLRTVVTLPLSIYQHKVTARIERLTLEMPAIVAELKREAAIAMKKFNWTEKTTRIVYNRSLKQQWNQLIVRDNCHPAKTLIVLWAQIPLWICTSVALRNLIHMLPDANSLQAKLIFTELTLGGFGWVPNLTEVDSSFILPVTLGLINLGIIEVQSMLRTRPPTRLQKYATNAFRVLSLVLVPVACSVPSALCVYWVASSAHGLGQNLMLASPAIRRAVGIPSTPSELAHPYAHIWQQIRTGNTRSVPNVTSEVSPPSSSEPNKSKSSTQK